MNSSFHNPWVKLMLEQVWLCQQATDVAMKCVDTELLFDSQALSDYCLQPSEKRLNPLEFHGKRKRSPSRRAPAFQQTSASASRQRKFRCTA